MAANTIVEVKCPRCGHAWSVDTAELDEEYHLIYKGDRLTSANTETYRVRCPICGTYVIVEIEPGATGD